VARIRIRQAHGGADRVISDGALPFFLTQGWVIIDTIDDDSDDPPLYLSAEESDARYAELGGIGDPATPTGSELRTFFEEKIDRTGAVAGDVPVLQPDGSLALEAGGGGGGTGAVDSVNTKTGIVVLNADDLLDGTDRKMMTAAERTKLTGLTATPSIASVVGLQAALDAKAAASSTPRILPYSATLPLRPNYPGPVIIQIPDAIKGTVTFGGTTTGGTTALVNNLDHVWTS
jgi:hypothetical protein